MLQRDKSDLLFSTGWSLKSNIWGSTKVKLPNLIFRVKTCRSVDPVRFLHLTFSNMTKYLKFLSKENSDQRRITAIAEITHLGLFSVSVFKFYFCPPPGPSHLLPMASSPTLPSATETGSTVNSTSSPACCPSLRRSGLAWTNCPCFASASDTWRSRASSMVSVLNFRWCWSYDPPTPQVKKINRRKNMSGWRFQLKYPFKAFIIQL